METYINNISEDNSVTVAQLAVEYPGALGVFTKHHIDYCCGGHCSLEEACQKIGLDPDVIKEEIVDASIFETSQSFRPETWSSSFLVDFILQNHHSYVRKAIPVLQAFLRKVCDAHGTENWELLSISKDFNNLADELLSHMEKEEEVLFPAIKSLEASVNDAYSRSLTIQSPVTAMEHEHVIAGDLIKHMRSLSNNYTTPDYACPTFKIAYQKLQEFDNDLMKHIHLENNILFERV